MIAFFSTMQVVNEEQCSNTKDAITVFEVNTKHTLTFCNAENTGFIGFIELSDHSKKPKENMSTVGTDTKKS